MSITLLDINLQVTIPNGWFWFCILLAIVVVTVLVMTIQGRQFYTGNGTTRLFSMMDLELASSGKDIRKIIDGIYHLGDPQTTRTIRALKGQLMVDFLFMPAIYGLVFLLCMLVSNKMDWYGEDIFAVLAWFQIFPWLADIIENIILLNQLKPGLRAWSDGFHKFYQSLEVIKWGLSLLATVCAFAAIFFFWLSGNYSADRLPYLLAIIIELLVFVLIATLVIGKRVEPVK